MKYDVNDTTHASASQLSSNGVLAWIMGWHRCDSGALRHDGRSRGARRSNPGCAQHAVFVRYGMICIVCLEKRNRRQGRYSFHISPRGMAYREWGIWLFFFLYFWHLAFGIGIRYPHSLEHFGDWQFVLFSGEGYENEIYIHTL